MLINYFYSYRTIKLSRDQLDILINFMENNQDFANGVSEHTEEKWKIVVEQLNNITAKQTNVQQCLKVCTIHTILYVELLIVFVFI